MRIFLTITFGFFALLGFSQVNFIKHDAKKIEANKIALKANRQNFAEAYNQLLHAADHLLLAKPPSVTYKEMTPPSGDKHDYMSMPRYWWPDSLKLDGLPYIRRDGLPNPELEKLDRTRLGEFCNAVSLLGWAYYFSNDEKYAKKAAEFLNVWFIDPKTRMNPNMKYGQTIPGRSNGTGRGAGILDAYGFIDVIETVQILKTSKSFSEADKKSIKNWFSEFAVWLETHPIGLEEKAAKNNHGVAYDVQIACYYRFVGRDEDAKKIISDFPKDRTFKQIEPDGRQPLELERTASFGYTVFNLMHIMDICDMAKNMNMDIFNATSSDGRSIVKAIDFVAPYLGKNQREWRYEQIQDWGGRQDDFAKVLLRADRFAPQKKYAERANSFLKNKKTTWEILLQ